MSKLSILKLNILVLLSGCVAFAQTGSISGTVRTQAGGALSNATVTLTNTSNNAQQTALTDSSGRYHFDNLPGGTYRLGMSTAQITGTPSEDIVLDPNRPKTVDITVQNTGTTTVATMKVEEATPELDTSTPRISTVYPTRYIQYLPQANALQRDGEFYGAYNLSLLSAGVASNGPYGIARGPVVGGQRPTSNNFYVDGNDNNNRALPGPLVSVSNEAVTEMFSLQNQFPPEWGHTAGGQFNAVIRTGTNAFHGALYDYLQNRNMNAVDATWARQGITDLPRFDQNRLGGNAGFAIIPNHLFLFGDFEYIPLGFSGVFGSPIMAPTAAGYRTLAGISGISATNLGVLQTYAGAAPAQTSTTLVNGVQIPIGVLPNNARQYQNQYNGVGSMDWNFGNSDQLKMRYVHNEIHANNNGSTLPAFFSPQSDRALMASVSEYHNFSPVMVNELRFSYSRFDQSIHTNNGLNFPGLSAFPNILIQQDLNLQLGSGLYAGTPGAQNTYNLGDNMSWQFGRHTVKFGGDARRFIGPISFAQFGNGVYTYSSLSGFLLDQGPNVSGIRSFGNLNYAGDNFDSYAYLNDSWQVTPTLTLNLGVKYAYVTVPSSLQQQGFNGIASVPGLIDFHNPNTQKTNFGPIVGMAWSPGFVKNTVVRAGFGMNYDTTYSAANIPSVPPGIVSTEFVNAFSPYGFGFYPGFFGYGGIVPVNVFTPTVTPEQARAQTTTYIPDQIVPYTMQWNASWQQQIFHRMVFEARYLGVKAVHLPVETQLNGSSPVTATNNLPLFYTQPTQAQLNSYTTTLNTLASTASTNPYTAAGFTSPLYSIQPWGYSWYNGLSLQASQRFSGGFQGIFSYTWSHLIDNLSGPGYNTAGNAFAETLAPKGSSVFDHRHRVVATALWDVGGIGSGGFHWVRDVLANVTVSGTYTYESPSAALLQSGVNTDLTGFGYGGVITNPNGTPGVGSGVTPQYNSSRQIVGYLVNNPNAQYISGAAGTYTGNTRTTLGFRPINNFDVTAYKRFAVRDRFSFEIHGDAYNVMNHPQFTGASISTIGFASIAASRNFLIPGTAAFADPTQSFASNARTLQVGLRLYF